MDVTRCACCGATRAGRTLRCASCGAESVSPGELVPSGRVLGMTSRRGHEGTPESVVMVETDEGLLVIGFASDDVRVGEQVTSGSERHGVPVFHEVSR